MSFGESLISGESDAIEGTFSVVFGDLFGEFLWFMLFFLFMFFWSYILVVVDLVAY